MTCVAKIDAVANNINTYWVLNNNAFMANYVAGKYNVYIVLHVKWRIILSDSNQILGRDSSVGIVTSYGMDGPGIESRWVARFSAPVQTGPGAHPASYTMGRE